MKRVVLLCLTLFGVSCADGPDSKRSTKILAPDQLQFNAAVSPFLERRCGTLDCHGSAGRPLRIFSARGLRLGSGDSGAIFPGSGETTPTERSANYRSVIGLEPEILSRVQAGKASPRDLLLLQKPLGLGDSIAQHKGGQVLASQGDPGEQCLVSWLTVGVDVDACNRATAGY